MLALDLQVMQKVLPKLHGQSETLLPLLAHLQSWATGSGLFHTAAKLAECRSRARTQDIFGFTSSRDQDRAMREGVNASR